jgi:hypothetical protein
MSKKFHVFSTLKSMPVLKFFEEFISRVCYVKDRNIRMVWKNGTLRIDTLEYALHHKNRCSIYYFGFTNPTVSFQVFHAQAWNKILGGLGENVSMGELIEYLWNHQTTNAARELGESATSFSDNEFKCRVRRVPGHRLFSPFRQYEPYDIHSKNERFIPAPAILVMLSNQSIQLTKYKKIYNPAPSGMLVVENEKCLPDPETDWVEYLDHMANAILPAKKFWAVRMNDLIGVWCEHDSGSIYCIEFKISSEEDDRKLLTLEEVLAV